MLNVVYVAPFLMPTTMRFVESLSKLAGINFILITQDPEMKVPKELRDTMAQVFRAENCLQTAGLLKAVKAVAKQWGPIARLMGTLEHIQVPLAEVRDRLDIQGMGAQAAENFRDKSQMKTVLRDHGLPCARHCLAHSAAEALAFADKVGFPLVGKPPAGAGSKNTYQFTQVAALKSYLEKYPPTAQGALLLEEFIRGEEYTFESVHIGGKRVWHGLSRYFPSPLEVLENKWIQWCIVLPREVNHPFFDEIRTLADKSVRALGMETGISHLEWFYSESGRIAISEVAARPPGGQLFSLHGFVHDMDIYDAWAELMVFEKFEPPPRQFAAGAAFLRGQGIGRIARIRGLETVKQALSPLIVEMKLPQLGQPASSSYEGDGYILVRHPQTSVVERALDLIINHVRVELK